MKKWLGILLTASLASCGGGDTTTNPANLVAKNDFESMDGWMGDAPAPSLTKEKAHSGLYSVSVRPGVDYGIGYSSLLGKMTPTRPQKIKLSAWVFVPSDQANANLVVEMRDPANPAAPPLLWQGIVLKKEVKKFNEWQQLEKVITLPAGATAATSFKMYLWRTDSAVPVYLDDVVLALDNDAK